MEIREVINPAEREGAFEVLRELRDNLSRDSFQTIYEAARSADGYTLVGAFAETRIIGVMGYRVLWDFVHGKHLYIDDLVVTKTLRSGGLGARLLLFAEEVAKKEGCQGLRLCTGIENEGGKRFYERNDWKIRSVAFKKSLSS